MNTSPLFLVQIWKARIFVLGESEAFIEDKNEIASKIGWFSDENVCYDTNEEKFSCDTRFSCFITTHSCHIYR